ncbi:MAG: response regulator transcription factor [Terriglobia bacterium]|nr:response regulator transcription factor [Terriglobia bacterium]
MLQELNRLLQQSLFLVAVRKLSDLEAGSNPGIPAADVYVIDAESVTGGTEQLVNQVLLANLDAKFLVLAGEWTEKTAFPMLGIGVKGLITHDLINQQLGLALEKVAAGGYWVPRTLLASFVDSVITRSRRKELGRLNQVEVSRREKDIVDCLLSNMSNKEIASKLNISERTVKFHVSNLLSKFKVQRRADLILLWYQQGSQAPGSVAASAASRRIQ